MRHLTKLIVIVLLTSASSYAEPYYLQPSLMSSNLAVIPQGSADYSEHRFLFSQLTFVDRSDPITVLREERTLALIRFWRTPRTQLFFGIGPTGFAGLNFTSRRSFLKRRPRLDLSDHSATIRALTHSSQ